ncbi:outer membrane receptor protein involved in Fe transport [Ereboglobus sp. PH5-5]|uniref:TonB-dependent receptor plug domain-containing protein n=1 Tax=Ereboglobus sp. PH5-5 TaxID=2940529 RepID=UPI002405664C|nr:TonB-dependent receptor plug domain-containing protein [Ereboglobus sp. PH5-5]MDF9832236.1 outer membrane receptor protein involved in Fe transport [Ereboglobus sp. PH5-5]
MNTNIQISRLRFASMAVGGLVLSGTLAMAQAVRPDTTPTSDTPPIPVTTRAATPAPIDDEIIMLSPFQVDATRDKGYYAENTLAGSRMRTNISDLGAAISVVTKQQMEDTASLDINDVFRYEINAEGSSTYTPISAPGRAATGYADNISGNSTGGGEIRTNSGANRLRGMGAPSMALNYYSALSQIPFDSYNAASVEINRGPNSLLFGMGNPAGIVNMSMAQALINKNTAQVMVRIDDRGSNRASFNFNKTLIKDKLAVYGALLYNDEQFERKPSYDITRRQYATVTYQPFKRTKITASIEGYKNDGRRPNFMTPKDYVTSWVNAGKPGYDPRSGTFVLEDGSVVPYVTNANSPLAENMVNYLKGLPNFVTAKYTEKRTDGRLTGATYDGVNVFTADIITNIKSPMRIPGIAIHASRPFQMLDSGNSVGFYETAADRVLAAWGTTTVTPAEADIWANPTWYNAYNASYTRSYGNAAKYAATMPSYKDPGVSNSAIYDWTDINTNQMNFAEARNTNYNVEFEQEILPGLLHFSAGWFRQDYRAVQNYTVAQLDAATLYVDTNLYLPDGTENKYFGQVYLEDTDADTWETSINTDQYRAMLAFTPDFTKNKGWTRWLGRHNILGLVSHHETETKTYRKRLMFVGAGSEASALRYLPDPTRGSTWSYTYGHGSRVGRSEDGRAAYRMYYLSSPGDPGGVVTHASGAWSGATSYTGDILGYNYNTNQWEPYNMTMGLSTHSAGTDRQERKLLSYSTAITSYLWKDRLITTFGIRRDENKTRTTDKGATTNAQKFVDGYYQTEYVNSFRTKWNELNGTTKTVGFVLKPFLNWEAIEKRAADGNLFWEFVRDFGISYNKSDNFDAPPASYVDYFGNALPKPVGNGKDYGVQFSLFQNKLFTRISWFKATSENNYINPSSAGSRLTTLIDTNSFRGWAERIALLNLTNMNVVGSPTDTADWVNLARASVNEDALKTEISRIWGQDYDYYANLPGTPYGTQTLEAKGVEVMMNYNPTPNWTMRLTAGKQRTVYNNVLKEFDAWYNHRNQFMENARAADFLNADKQQYATYTPFNSTTPVILDEFWQSSGYIAEYGPNNAYGYRVARDYYEGVVTPEELLAKILQGQVAPGQRKYRASFVTNYVFTHGPLKGFSVGGAQRWEDKAIIGYYGKASNPLTPEKIDLADTSRPMYDSAKWYTDLWVAYTCKVFNNKARMKIQLNVTDVFQDGELQVVARNYDGSPVSYRIMDPRKFILTATFDF